MMKVVKKEEKKIASAGKEIRKRNGTLVPFEIERIESAIWKAMRASEEVSEAEALIASKKVAKHVLVHVTEKRKADKAYIPSVEEVQDMVEQALISENYGITAKAYILYREKRSELRLEQGSVPEHIKKLVHESKQYFKNPLGEFLFYRTYARWVEDEGRRETWIETIDRYMNFMRENLGSKLKDGEYKELREAILKQEVMPSMRLLQFAGKAARSTNVCAYNCSFIAPSKFRDFAEIMYISMCGTGVGWSVESRNIQSLPQIKRQTGKMLSVNVIHDSKEGWCDSLILGMNTWAQGNDIKFDFSKLRPAGARLATMVGKSSGPEPLRALLDFTRERMIRRQG
ncbi:MAG: ATP cone domain-containing protein, partial [Patescibacteria group bacterium]